MKKIFVLAIAIVLGTTMYGGTASAAQPAVQGCLGEGMSTNAQLWGSGWAEVISWDARNDSHPNERNGLGDEIQWVMGGNPSPMPNNTCYVP